MKSWQGVYSSGAFSIATNEPSKLVVRYADKILPDNRVLDLGCGSGRNAIFLASRGHPTDAIDSTDLAWTGSLPHELKDKICFRQQDLDDLHSLGRQYGAILMMRLLQYLTPQTVTKLFGLIGDSLTPGGLVVASYSTTGNLRVAKLGIDTYTHSPQLIRKLCRDNSLEMISCKSFGTVSQHVPYHSAIEVCEFVARKAR